IWVVDSQCFGDENLGTCLLIGPADVGKEKAVFAADILNLNARLEARGFAEKLDVFSGHLGKEVPYPSVVVGGVDNIDARHEIQRIWADMIIDGAIGDFGCQVSRHPWSEEIACLMCLFRHPGGEPAEHVASRLTGLHADRVLQELSIVTESDIVEAPEEKQQWLSERIGHQICSVIQEAVAQQLSEEQHRQGFAPSVPFVASLSASMVVTELIKYITGWALSNPLEPRFQCDVLRGPEHGLAVPQVRRRDCICTTRKRNIDHWRQQRNRA
ncbi:MAG TPA: ThiF family adenylyltransferase, partial [Ktedonobacteraceae bacterium]|nr:ThiF family adenylyltransferase [Ktedonobacteraceae bacterium]